MQTKSPQEGTCGICGEFRVVVPAKPEWGDVPAILCVRHWSDYEQARSHGSYFDWRDAFDNASDEELESAITYWGI